MLKDRAEPTNESAGLPKSNGPVANSNAEHEESEPDHMVTKRKEPPHAADADLSLRDDAPVHSDAAANDPIACNPKCLGNRTTRPAIDKVEDGVAVSLKTARIPGKKE